MSADMILLTDVASLEKITYEHGQLLISVAVAANGVINVNCSEQRFVDSSGTTVSNWQTQ